MSAKFSLLFFLKRRGGDSLWIYLSFLIYNTRISLHHFCGRRELALQEAAEKLPSVIPKYAIYRMKKAELSCTTGLPKTIAI